MLNLLVYLHRYTTGLKLTTSLKLQLSLNKFSLYTDYAQTSPNYAGVHRPAPTKLVYISCNIVNVTGNPYTPLFSHHHFLTRFSPSNINFTFYKWYCWYYLILSIMLICFLYNLKLLNLINSTLCTYNESYPLTSTPHIFRLPCLAMNSTIIHRCI